MLAAVWGRKLGRPLLSQWRKAQLSSFLTDFVDPKIFITFSSPFGRREVDGFGFLRGIEDTGSFADLLLFRTESPGAVGAVDHNEFPCVLFLRLFAVDLKGNDSPCAFDYLAVFPDRLVLGLVATGDRRHRRQKHSDEKKSEQTRLHVGSPKKAVRHIGPGRLSDSIQ